MDKQKIRSIIQEEIANYNKNNMFGFSNIPIHTHSGTDSVKIPISSTEESIPIVGTVGGVFDPLILDTQKVNNEYTTGRKNPQTIYDLPINTIYGNGVGVHSAFNGGEAGPGTMIFFENATNSGLWVYTINGWRGVNFPLSI